MGAVPESLPPAEATATRPPSSRRAARENGGNARIALLLACGSAFIAVFDPSAVNIALPDLRGDFATATLPTLSWVITSYAVFFAAILVAAGRLADVLGRRRLFRWSAVAFGVTSALSAVASNEGFLIAFRALQGAAGAGMVRSALGLVLVWTARERVRTALGTWSAVGLLASVAGPAAGGVLIGAWGWRAIFMVNVPVVLAMLWAMGRLSADEPHGRRLPDLLGVALFAAGAGVVVVGLSQGSTWGWRSVPVLASLVGGVVLVGACLARSARHPAPAVELSLWRGRAFAVANAAMLPLSVAMFSFVLVGPLFLTSVWGYSGLEAGLAITPGALANAAATAVAGRLVTTPAARRAAVVGGCLLFTGAAMYLWAGLGSEPRFLAVFLPAQLAFGLGIGAALTAVYGAGSISVPLARFATGNAQLTTTRDLGGALGVAAVVTIIAAPGFAAAAAGGGGGGPYQAAYLFSGVAAAVAAAAGTGLAVRAPIEAARPVQFQAVEASVPPASRSARRLRLAALAAIITTILGIGALSASIDDTTGCSRNDAVVIRVAVAPDIEPALRDAVGRFNNAKHEIDGTCVQVEATAIEPAQITTLLGQSGAVGDPALPDAWIPDSSLWISLLLSLAEERRTLEGTGTSLARSPVVAAMPHGLADELRGRGMTAEAAWDDLVAVSGRFTSSSATESPLAIPPGLARLRLPDPTRNAAGLAALLILDQLHAGEPDQATRFTGMVRNLQEQTLPEVASGFAEFGADDQGRYPIIIGSEQSVFAFNQRHLTDPALAVYPSDGTLWLDYPYLVTTHDSVTSQAARMFTSELRGEQTQADIRTLGFRSADGTPPPAFGPQPATNPPALPTPRPADVLEAVQTWHKLSQGARNLTLIDISGPTTEQVGPSLSRLEATTQAARGVVAAMPDDTQLGVWLYAYELNGTQDWVQLISVGPLGETYGPTTRREVLDVGLGQLGPVPENRTGLYDTVLTAYRMMQRDYDPKLVNSVLLFTDGTNNDPKGTSLSGLVTALRGEYDPARPVQIVVIGFGDDIDRSSLDQIAEVTRGSVYLAQTPQQVQQILLAAMSRRITGS